MVSEIDNKKINNGSVFEFFYDKTFKDDLLNYSIRDIVRIVASISSIHFSREYNLYHFTYNIISIEKLKSIEQQNLEEKIEIERIQKI